jgi:hypothetical protein
MTLFWLWVIAGCAACGLAGFSFMRFGTRRFVTAAPAQARAATTSSPPPARAPVVFPRAPMRVERPARPAAPRAKRVVRAPTPPPAPTVPRPAAEKLALWTRQVKAGERKMSLATDGCRVTWNRTCKHGHPTWLVHLGYLKRHPGPKRHHPR